MVSRRRRPRADVDPCEPGRTLGAVLARPDELAIDEDLRARHVAADAEDADGRRRSRPGRGRGFGAVWPGRAPGAGVWGQSGARAAALRGAGDGPGRRTVAIML